MRFGPPLCGSSCCRSMRRCGHSPSIPPSNPSSCVLITATTPGRNTTRRRLRVAPMFCVSIMSQDTLKAMEPHLITSQSTNTTIRVLTWHRDTPAETVELLRKHLQENDEHPERTHEQLRDAVTGWRALEK